MTTLIVVILIGLAVAYLLSRDRDHQKRRTTTEVRRAVVCLTSGNEMLVMRRVEKLRPAERLELPKGRVGRKEDPLAAAYRECLEESGLRPAALETLLSLKVKRGKKGPREVWEVLWGEVPEGVTLPAEHRVTGKGQDRGRVYQLGLIPLEQVKLPAPLDTVVPAVTQHLALRQIRASKTPVMESA